MRDDTSVVAFLCEALGTHAYRRMIEDEDPIQEKQTVMNATGEQQREQRNKCITGVQALREWRALWRRSIWVRVRVTVKAP